MLVITFLMIVFPLFTPNVNGGVYYSTIKTDFQLQYNVTDYNMTSDHTNWTNLMFVVVAPWDAAINQTVNATINKTSTEITKRFLHKYFVK